MSNDETSKAQRPRMHNPDTADGSTSGPAGASDRRAGRQTAGRAGRLVVLLAAVAIVVLAAVLRLEGIGRDELWCDEFFTLRYARLPLTDTTHWFIGMVLYETTLHEWMQVAGDSNIALRHPSAAYGVGAVILLMLLVWRMNGWPTALLAGLLLAVSWQHIYFSQEARAYSLFVTLSVLTTYLLVWLLTKWSVRRLVIYGISLLLLAYTHYQFVFMVGFHTAVVYLVRRRLGRAWLVLLGALAVAYVPQLIIGMGDLAWRWKPYYIPTPPSLGYAAGVLQDFFGIPPYLPITSHIPGATTLNLAVLFVMPVAAAAGIIACVQRALVRPGSRLAKALPVLSRYTAPVRAGGVAPKWVWLPALWFGFVFVAPFLVAQIGKPIFLGRYVVGTMPPLCWLVAAGITSVRRAAVRWPAAAVCVLLALPAVETMKAFPMRTHWGACVREIERDERPGDRIVIVPGFLHRVFLHAYHGDAHVDYIFGSAMTDAETTKALKWDESPPPRVWIVVARAPETTVMGYFKRRPDYRLVMRRDYPPFGSFDYAPRLVRGPAPVLLMLFERVPGKGPEAERAGDEPEHGEPDAPAPGTT
jgi:mannosyltransferase